MAKRTRRSPAPAPWLLAALAVGLVIGLVGASSVVVVIVLVIVFVGVWALAFRRGIAAMTVAPEGPVPCPRCGDASRTASGWCEPCTALLREHPVPDGHPIHAFAAAAEARDFEAMAACVTEPSTMVTPSGRRLRLSRKRFQRNARMGMRLFRGGTSSVVAMYREPAEPDSVWLHSRDTGHGFLGSGAVDVQFVIRYRVEDGLIAEAVYSPPLPRAYSGLAA